MMVPSRLPRRSVGSTRSPKISQLLPSKPVLENRPLEIRSRKSWHQR